MPEPWLYLKGLGAAAIASTLFVLAIVGSRRSATMTWLNSACVAGIGLGLAVGCAVSSLGLVWPPRNGLDRLVTIVVPAALSIELVAGFQRVPRWVPWTLRISLAAMIPRILLHGSVYLTSSHNEWTLCQASGTMAVCGALLAAVWCLLALLFQRDPGISIPLTLILAIQCAGLTVMMAGYIKGGVAAMTLAATLLATTIAGTLVTKHPAAPVIIGIGVVGLFGMLFIGRFFGAVSTGSALATLCAPLLSWATEVPQLRHQKPWLLRSLRVVLVAILLILVLAVAKLEFDQNMAPLLGR